MKQINKIYVVALCVSTIMLQSCYTRKPVAGNISHPDYNKRIAVSGAKMKKKGNGLNIAFNIGLVGAGAYGGYQTNLIQKQTAEGKEPVHAANIAVGALAGASVAYLIDAIAGKNKKESISNPDEWIRKANKEYLLLERKSTYSDAFTIIHSSAERNYIVNNTQDVRDFKAVFPNSNYTDQMFQQAIKVLKRDEIPLLLDLYPDNRYVADARTKYIKESLFYDDAFIAAKKYPVTNADEYIYPLIRNVNNAISFVRAYPDTRYKKEAVILAFNDPIQSASDIKDLHKDYGDFIFLSQNDLKNANDSLKRNYYIAMYTYNSPDTEKGFDDFYSKYAWLQFSQKNKTILSCYWDLINSKHRSGTEVISKYKNFLFKPLYANINITNKDIKEVMEQKLSEEAKRNVKIKSKYILGSTNEEWENWKSSSYTAGLVSEKDVIQYIVYGELENNSKFDLPIEVAAGGVLEQRTQIKGQGAIMETIIQLGTAITGQSTTQQQLIGAATERCFYPNLSSKDKVMYAIMLDFGEGIKNMGVNILDLIKGSTEMVLTHDTVNFRFNSTPLAQEQLKKQNIWLQFARNGLPSGKLVDFVRNEEVRQDVWDIRYEEFSKIVQESIDASRQSAYSGLYSSEDNYNSSENMENSNIHSIKIARMNQKKSEYWKDDSGMIDEQDKRYIVFDDNVSGTIYRFKSDAPCDQCYWIGGGPNTIHFFYNELDAINALYVYHKYDYETFKKFKDFLNNR